MSERDPLRDALSATAQAVRPFVVPPGVEATRRTLRRRRARPAVAAVVVLLAFLGIAWVLPSAFPTPPTDVVPSASASADASPSATPSPTAGPTPSTPPGVVGQVNGGPAPTRSSSPKAPSCNKAAAYAYSEGASGDSSRIGARLLCPGQRMRVFWASYEVLADGRQQLVASEVYYLTPAKPSVIAYVSIPERCPGLVVTVQGNEAVRQTLPVGSGLDTYQGTIAAVLLASRCPADTP